MRISADKDRCIGAGHCVRAAPDLFDSGDDGRVTVLHPEPDPSRAASVREVVALCPNTAISLSEGPGKPFDGSGGKPHECQQR